MGRPLLLLTPALLALAPVGSKAAVLAMEPQGAQAVVNTAAEVRDARILRPDEPTPVADLSKEPCCLGQLTLDSQGRLYVYETGGVTVASGGEQRRIGEGLVENLVGMAAARDTVLLFDKFRQPSGRAGVRVHVLHVGGEQLETVPYEGRDLNNLRGTDAGWMAVRRRASTAAAADTLDVVQLSPRTGETRVLSGYPYGRARLLRSGRRTTPPPDGVQDVAIAADGRVYTHPGHRHVIDVKTPDGVLQKRLVTEVEGWAPSRMLASRDGHVFVRRRTDEESGSPGDRWDLFDPEGRIAGFLSVEEEQALLAFEWPHVYMTVPDGTEAVQVVRFRLNGSG